MATHRMSQIHPSETRKDTLDAPNPCAEQEYTSGNGLGCDLSRGNNSSSYYAAERDFWAEREQKLERLTVKLTREVCHSRRVGLVA